MANEISWSATVSASKGGATVKESSSGRITMAGDDMLQNTQIIGTSAELVSFGDITGVPAYVQVKNLDATNFVEFGGDSGLTVFKLKLLPGDATRLCLTSATLYAKADTAAVRILVVAVEA